MKVFERSDWSVGLVSGVTGKRTSNFLLLWKCNYRYGIMKCTGGGSYLTAIHTN